MSNGVLSCKHAVVARAVGKKPIFFNQSILAGFPFSGPLSFSTAYLSIRKQPTLRTTLTSPWI